MTKRNRPAGRAKQAMTPDEIAETMADLRAPVGSPSTTVGVAMGPARIKAVALVRIGTTLQLHRLELPMEVVEKYSVSRDTPDVPAVGVAKAELFWAEQMISGKL